MGTSWRAVWQYSAKRARRDSVILEAQRRRALDAVDGIKPARRPRFVKTTRSGCSFDEKAFERAQKLEGLKGYVTNLPATLMPATEVIDSYHELWHVEQSFRMSKTDLRARPIFHRQKDAIEAHLTIVMAALAVSRYLYQKTGITPKKLVRTLRPLREITISLPGGQQITAQPEINPETQKILNKLGH
ncbi:IS1549, transposase family protein [Mobiluncus mulieris FB024-16]|nr:IS1549, transposase family protein [Mobiluncus mulieris FB024-16]